MNTIKIHNVTTGEVIERERNAEELTQWEQEVSDYATKQAEAEAKKAAAEAKLKALGLTADDLAALGL